MFGSARLGAREREPVEDGRDPALGFGGGPAPLAEAVGDVLPHGQVWPERAVLKDVPDAAEAWRHGGDVIAVDEDAPLRDGQKAGDRAQDVGFARVRRPEEREELPVADVHRDPAQARGRPPAGVEPVEPDVDERPRGDAHARAPAPPLLRSGTPAGTIAASRTYRAPGEVHVSRVVATTGPRNPAPMRAELMTPIAAPPACWTRRATTSGNTGAIDSTCRKRKPP